MPPPHGPQPAPTPERCLTLSNDLWQYVTRVRDGMDAAAEAARDRGDLATAARLLDLADLATGFGRAWDAEVHQPLAAVAFPTRPRPAAPPPAPSPAPDEIQATPQPRPARAKRKAKPQPEGAR